MTRVQLTETGRVVHAPDDVARRWVESGVARLAPLSRETTSRTSAPMPARLAGVETR